MRRITWVLQTPCKTWGRKTIVDALLVKKRGSPDRSFPTTTTTTTTTTTSISNIFTNFIFLELIG